MQSFCRFPNLGPRSLHTTTRLFYPTALHRAEQAADLKKNPESATTQQKLEDVKHNHHWAEKNATQSEANVGSFLLNAHSCLLGMSIWIFS
jgi:hypothetical protein